MFSAPDRVTIEAFMTWYADLAPCDYFGVQFAPQLRAIGWLERGHPFPTGTIPKTWFVRLCELLRDPWNPAYPAGHHACDLCQFSGDSGGSSFHDYRISSTAAASLFIPGDGVIYAAPVSISHYIDCHGYRPPDNFYQAVEKCPAMRSTAYFQALLVNGGRELVRSGRH
jgi:hypothetical protein